MTGNWIEKVNEEILAAKNIPDTPEMTLDNLAYVVYSSGTTGKPKGEGQVQQRHRGLLSLTYDKLGLLYIIPSPPPQFVNISTYNISVVVLS